MNGRERQGARQHCLMLTAWHGPFDHEGKGETVGTDGQDKLG